ncbi:hypothetical protein C8F01DRAFT_564071 [Mycena amicta]|nr:hypothetical protein C8F01DRAFT_564071 [Mycena amicta]
MPPKRRAKANATPKPKRPPRPFDETKARKDMEQAAAAHSRLDVIGPKIRRGGNSKHISSLRTSENDWRHTSNATDTPSRSCHRKSYAKSSCTLFLGTHSVRLSSGYGLRMFYARSAGSWREIALGTSALWAGISVALHRNSLLPHKLELVKLALARSNSHPLSILFKADKDIDVLPFAQVLFAHSARWEHVAIKLSWFCILSSRGSIEACLCSRLSPFQPSLDGPAGDLKAVPAVLMDAFQTAPGLAQDPFALLLQLSEPSSVSRISINRGNSRLYLYG